MGIKYYLKIFALRYIVWFMTFIAILLWLIFIDILWFNGYLLRKDGLVAMFFEYAIHISAIGMYIWWVCLAFLIAMERQ